MSFNKLFSIIYTFIVLFFFRLLLLLADVVLCRRAPIYDVMLDYRPAGMPYDESKGTTVHQICRKNRRGASTKDYYGTLSDFFLSTVVVKAEAYVHWLLGRNDINEVALGDCRNCF